MDMATTRPLRRRRGRPALPAEQRQTELICTRLKPGEQRRLALLLEREGMKDSDFLRDLVLKQIEGIEDPGEPEETGEGRAA